MAGKTAISRKGIGGRPKGEPTRVIRLPVAVADIARRIAQRSLRAGDISAFLDVEGASRVTVPLANARASCGFPSPADDYLERALDFNELLVHNPAATFAVRLSSDSMTGAGLFPGDIAIVDRSVEPTNGCIVWRCSTANSRSSATSRKRGVALARRESRPMPRSRSARGGPSRSGASSPKSIRML